jgi:hypothetical protein
MSETPPAAVNPQPAAPAWRVPLLGLLAFALTLGLASLFWLDARNRIGATQEEVARHRG